MIFDYTKFQVPLYWFHLFRDVPSNLCHKKREFKKLSKPAARRAAPAFFNGVLKQLLTLGWQVDTQDELVLGSCLHPSSPSPHHPLVDCCWQAAHTAVQAADENLYKLPLLHSTSDEGIRKIQTNTKKSAHHAFISYLQWFPSRAKDTARDHCRWVSELVTLQLNPSSWTAINNAHPRPHSTGWEVSVRREVTTW